MLEISRRADYGVRIMIELGKRPERRIPAGDLVGMTGVPKPFLHKIIADLARVGLIRTFQGPTGGVELGRQPEQISMLDILEASDGPVCMNICLARPHECPRDSVCPAHTFWGRLQSMVVAEMRAMTLDKLIEEAASLATHGRREPIQYVFSNGKGQAVLG